LLDIEVNPFLIRDIHDILNSLLCSSLNEKTLKRWLFLLRDIAISAEADTSMSSSDQSSSASNTPTERKNNKKKKKQMMTTKMKKITMIHKHFKRLKQLQLQFSLLVALA
jgi:hypothetical protein